MAGTCQEYTLFYFCQLPPVNSILFMVMYKMKSFDFFLRITVIDNSLEHAESVKTPFSSLIYLKYYANRVGLSLCVHLKNHDDHLTCLQEDASIPLRLMHECTSILNESNLSSLFLFLFFFL